MGSFLSHQSQCVISNLWAPSALDLTISDVAILDVKIRLVSDNNVFFLPSLSVIVSCSLHKISYQLRYGYLRGTALRMQHINEYMFS